MEHTWCICEQRPPEPDSNLCWMCNALQEQLRNVKAEGERIRRNRRRAENLVAYACIAFVLGIGFVSGVLSAAIFVYAYVL